MAALNKVKADIKLDCASWKYGLMKENWYWMENLLLFLKFFSRSTSHENFGESQQCSGEMNTCTAVGSTW